MRKAEYGGERLEKPRIFTDGLTAGRQRDAPPARVSGSSSVRPTSGKKAGNGASEGR
jgi:hypothetical protein